jgi:DNA-3-methyladenine glycosylase I
MPEEDSSIQVDEDGVARCWWPGTDPFYRQYHDAEWGRPMHQEHRLFEKLVLEGFQSGLSWLTILRKRENFRAAFDGFDPHRVAAYDSTDVERLLGDAGIVRHRGKIESTINNAQRCLELIDREGSLDAFIWSMEPDRQRPEPDTRADWPGPVASMTATSTRLSKELKRRGWSFVGPTTMYAFMQAMGLVNDHLPRCFAHDECNAARRAQPLE